MMVVGWCFMDVLLCYFILGAVAGSQLCCAVDKYSYRYIYKYIYKYNYEYIYEYNYEYIYEYNYKYNII